MPCAPWRSERAGTGCAWNMRRAGSTSGPLSRPSPGPHGSAPQRSSGIAKGGWRVPELSVVVPAFRERANIPALLQALEQALAGLDWETIVVVDDAFDGSEELVRERAQRDPRVRCIQRIGRRGLASACIEGMLASSAPYIAVIDANLQHDETLVPQLLAKVRGEEADVAVASRYMAGGSTGELGPQRVRLSRLAATLSATLCEGLTDPMSGFFVVRRTFLDRVVRNLYGRGFKILLDLIAAPRGKIRIAELAFP